MSRPTAETRRLTPAEAQAIQSVLAGTPGEGLPTSTFGAVHRRALEAGWIVERYLPNPVLFGWPRATFALAHRHDLLHPDSWNRWEGLGVNALTWQGSELLFGVFFDRPGSGRTGIARELNRATEYDRAYALEVDLRGPTVPVYFDFEAIWSRICGRSGTAAYPRALPMTTVADPEQEAGISPRWRRTVEGAVRAPGEPLEVASSRMRRLGHRGVIRRAVEHGWIDRRIFLDPTVLPGVEDWLLRDLVFVHGTLREGRVPEMFFQKLVSDCGLAPFLFATDSTEVLLGSFAPAPRAPRTSGPTVPVRSMVQAFLDPFAVDRQGVQQLEVLVNHRYDALLVGGAVIPSPSEAAAEGPAPSERPRLQVDPPGPARS